MNEEERKKLVEDRKKELAEDERRKELYRDLSLQEQKSRVEEILQKEYNRYTVGLIIFLGTFIPLYFIYWCLKALVILIFGPALALIGVGLPWLDPVVTIWLLGIALISVIRKKSLLEDFIFRFF